MSNPQTFTSFKAGFYSRFKDAHLFDCADFNLTKVVLDGLKIQYSSRGKISRYFYSPLPVYQLILFLKRLRKGNGGKYPLTSFGRLKKRPYVIVDNCSINPFVPNENGENVSRFFERVIQVLGREKTSALQIIRDDENPYFDLYLRKAEDGILFSPLNEEEKLLRKALVAKMKEFKKSTLFSETELIDIGFAVENFFKKFRVWNAVMKYLEPKVLFFNTHYHFEGALLAIKRNKVLAIELQHGLIAPEDIFYMMPEFIRPVREKACFADYILTYGEFWSDRLRKGFEYGSEQILNCGYYLYERSALDEGTVSRINNLLGKKRMILVATQISLHEHFIKYVSFLATHPSFDPDQWIICIKPHIAEDVSVYSELRSFKGVLVIDEHIENLLRFSEILISIYSTVLYDAMRYGVRGYALSVPGFADYVDTIVNSGVAIRLGEQESPIGEKRTMAGTGMSSFFDNFKPEIIRRFMVENTERK